VVDIDGIQALMLTFQMVGISCGIFRRLKGCGSPGSRKRISGFLHKRSTPHAYHIIIVVAREVSVDTGLWNLGRAAFRDGSHSFLGG
jgi:hypothetical protein